MSLGKLNSIPGVGTKTAAKLVEYFGSEEEALEAVENLDYHSLASSGIGTRPALNIVLAFYSQKLGVSPDDVLRTQEAKALYSEALETFKSKVSNPLSRERFDLFYPLPCAKLDAILDRIELSRQAVQLVKGLGEPVLSEADEALASVQPVPRSIKPRVDRTVIVESEDDYGRLKEMGVDGFCRLELLEGGESLRDHLESEEHVVLVLKRSIYDLEAEAEFVEVFHGAPSLNELVPELVTQVFTQNAKTVLALDALAKCLGKFPDVPAVNRIRSRIDADALGRILEALNELGTDPGSERGKEAARIERALGKVGNAIRESETEVNAEVERYLSTYEARVSGETIAELLREASAKSVSPERLMAVIPGEVLERIRGMVRQAERSLKERLSLDAAEAEWLEGIFPDSVSLPIEVSEEAADRLRMNLSKKLTWLRFKILSDAAKKLAPLVGAFREAVSSAFELDALLAIGKVGSSKGFAIPKIEPEAGVWFKDAANTRLSSSGSASSIQAVTYGIGSGSKLVGGAGERVVLLTGANSGGKTMLLSTVAQVAMLAQSGLPVQAAEAGVYPFDQIFFFSRPAGIKDAGAFESALRALVEVASTGRSKLVLVDEFEAATEPGAAAKVLASVIEMFAEQEKSLVVVVTHLAQQLLASVSVPLRVDGIEARGLDANYNLVVDRSPKINYLARSTPELIVERLLRKSKDPARRVYEKILEKVRSGR